MPYPEFMIQPMRQELTSVGFEELRTAEQVDEVVNGTEGTVMIVVNSVCGCAAGKARPGIARSLQNAIKPDRITTVFAGADIDATDRARGYFTGYAPSSPSIGILKGGKLVYLMQRSDIEVRGPQDIAQELINAYETHCSKETAVAG